MVGSGFDNKGNLAPRRFISFEMHIPAILVEDILAKLLLKLLLSLANSGQIAVNYFTPLDTNTTWWLEINIKLRILN